MSTDSGVASGFEVPGWPTFPAGVLPHATINVHADDPALLDSGKRQCVSCRKADGARCGAPAVTGRLLCSMHAGLADPALAAQAKHQQDQERKREAEEALGRRSLGTRAMIADVLHERAEDVAKVVNGLIDQARDGDLKAQSLLLPYINQALGLPTERVEHVRPSTADEVDRASTTTLMDMVAQARERRAQAAAASHESTG